MNRRDMIRALGIFGVGMTVFPHLGYTSEPTNVNRWEPTGLLDGLSDKAKTKMIVLLDNTERQIEEHMTTDKHCDIHELEFARTSFYAITRSACEPFLDDDRFQTMKLPYGVTSNGTHVVAKTRWSKVCVGVPMERELDEFKHDHNFILNSYIVPLRNTIDTFMFRELPDRVLYVYMPIIHCPLSYHPHDHKRYGAFFRYNALVNGPRESV